MQTVSLWNGQYSNILRPFYECHRQASAAVRSIAVALFLLIYVYFFPIVCGGFVFRACFVVQYSMSFLVLQSSSWVRWGLVALL